MSNTEAKTDLLQRDFVIDGVNGFDFLQQSDTLMRPFDDEQVVLNVRGVPVLVNPVLMENTESKTDLLQRDLVIDGVNGFDYI